MRLVGLNETLVLANNTIELLRMQIRKLSVKQITSPLSLDNLKHPIPNGYYDPALGPLDMFDT